MTDEEILAIIDMDAFEAAYMSADLEQRARIKKALNLTIEFDLRQLARMQATKLGIPEEVRYKQLKAIGDKFERRWMD